MIGRDDIKNILERMLGIEGIAGAMAVTSDGHILGSEAELRIKDYDLTEISQVLTEMLESIRDFGINPHEIFYHFNRSRLTIKSINDGYLFVLCDPTVSCADVKYCG